MILDGITCKAYGPIKTVVSQALKGQKNSEGRLFWYDLGSGLSTYDNLTITFTVSSEDGAALEALTRRQLDDSALEVALSNDEWLYDYTGDFTIQSYKTIKRSDRDYTEYGYEVTLATAEPIDMLLLTGDRTECTGAGYITYNGVSIPQPKDYNFEYQTHKYAGLTHGSSFSEELPTIERDRTKFNVKMRAGNMRAMVDAMSTTRGAVFFTTFPAYAFPFGLQRGNTERQYITIRATDTYEFTTNGDEMYSTLIDLYSIDEDAPAVADSYFLANSTGVDFEVADWTMVGSVATNLGSGLFLDSAAGGGVYGNTEYLGKMFSGAWDVTMSVPFNGTVQMVNVHADVDNNFYVRSNRTSPNNYIELNIVVGGVLTTESITYPQAAADLAFVTFNDDGENITITCIIKEATGTTVTFSKTWVVAGTMRHLASRYMFYQTGTGGNATLTRIYQEGLEYPTPL